MIALVITALYPPAVGGAATYFGHVLPRLAQHDEVDALLVLTERMSGEPRESAQGKLRLLRYLPTRVSTGQHPWLIHAITYVLAQLWFAAFLPRLVRRCRADVVHFHTRYRGRLFYRALQRCDVAVIADLRDKMTDPARLVTVAGSLLCCGRGVQRFAVNGGFPSERITLIPIPLIRPELPSAEEVEEVRRRYALGSELYLLFLGDVTYNKGVYDLLDAHSTWGDRHRGVRLVLAGPNREGERFLSRVREVPGADYLGRVSHGDALSLMRGAQIVVLPSRSEGLPRVILEAVALGRKVLCPPSIPEFDRHLARFVLPEVTADAIVSTLETVWQSAELPSYPLEQHSVDRVVEALADAYRTVERVL